MTEFPRTTPLSTCTSPLPPLPALLSTALLAGTLAVSMGLCSPSPAFATSDFTKTASAGSTTPTRAAHTTEPTEDQLNNRETPVPPSGKLDQPQYVTIKSRENTIRLYPDDSANGHCERDPWASNFQQCLIYSPAMKRNIPIHFKPATRGSHSALLLLDGASAKNSHNRWIYKYGAPTTFANTNINVIAPIGGGPSWYTDWQYPNCSIIRPHDNPQKWETFLTKELPLWGKRTAHIHPRLYSVAGFSMGGGNAIALAERHPAMFRQALSYSGTLSYSIPGMQPFLNMISDVSFCWWGPYGSSFNPSRYQQDPTLNIGKLEGKNIDIYASAGNGIPEKGDGAMEYFNMPWEIGSRVLLRNFSSATQKANVPATVVYRDKGSHNYSIAYRELARTKPRILKVMRQAERRIYQKR